MNDGFEGDQLRRLMRLSCKVEEEEWEVCEQNKADRMGGSAQ